MQQKPYQADNLFRHLANAICRYIFFGKYFSRKSAILIIYCNLISANSYANVVSSIQIFKNLTINKKGPFLLFIKETTQLIAKTEETFLI